MYMACVSLPYAASTVTSWLYSCTCAYMYTQLLQWLSLEVICSQMEKSMVSAPTLLSHYIATCTVFLSCHKPWIIHKTPIRQVEIYACTLLVCFVCIPRAIWGELSITQWQLDMRVSCLECKGLCGFKSYLSFWVSDFSCTCTYSFYPQQRYTIY